MLLVHFCPLSVYACFPHSTHMPCFTTTYSVAIVARRFTVSWLGSALLYKDKHHSPPLKHNKDLCVQVRKLYRLTIPPSGPTQPTPEPLAGVRRQRSSVQLHRRRTHITYPHITHNTPIIFLLTTLPQPALPRSKFFLLRSSSLNPREL